MDTHRLIEAARKGDEEAYRRLVEPHLPTLYRTAALIVLDEHLARDAVQEALLRAYRFLRRLRDPEAFSVWLHRLAVNEARRLSRRRGRELPLLVEPPEAPDPSIRSDPELSALAGEDRRRLWDAVARLGDLHRTALVLHYYRGLSVREIADLLAVRSGTVKSRLHHARHLLQKALGEEGGADAPLASMCERSVPHA